MSDELERDDRHRVAEAWLEAGLEEVVGEVRPPDLSERILAAASGSARARGSQTAVRQQREPVQRAIWPRLLAAAVLVGTTVLLVLWLQNAAAPRSAGPGASPIDDPPRSAARPNPRLRVPASAAQAAELLAGLRELRIELRTVGARKLPVKVADRPYGPEIVLATEGDELREIRDLLIAVLQDPGEPVPAMPWTHELRWVLADRDYLAGFAGLDPNGRAILHLHGLPPRPCRQELLDALSQRAFLQAADIETQNALGILHRDDLQPQDGHFGPLSPSSTKIRAHEFTALDLPRLQRFALLRSLDLRWSPAVNDPRGFGQIQSLPNLTHLWLAGQGVDAKLVSTLVNLKHLQELRFLEPNDTAWQPELRPAAGGLDDQSAAALVKLRDLEELVLPGARLTDQGLAALAKLEKLGDLVLSGAPLLTGSGFAAFAEHRSLDELLLSHCGSLDVAGIQAIARLPALSHLSLAYSPVTVKTGDVAEATLACLQALATSRTLHRLELGGWLNRASEPARALQELAKAPNLDWLSLADSPELTADDLASLAGAKNLRVLDLSGTAGKGPGLIPIEALDFLFERLPKLETLVTR